jgi:hypothetical protein
MILRCDRHGRLPWLGHARCDECERMFKNKPPRCPCGALVKDLCAKCFAAEARSQAQTAFLDTSELGSMGYETR